MTDNQNDGKLEISYGIIKKEDGSTYISPIFALKYFGWKSEAIVFDETFSQIKKIKLWRTFFGFRRRVFVIKDEFDSKYGRWAGFDFVINNKKLFKALRFGKSASIDRFPEFKGYTEKIEMPEVFELKTDKDIASLETASMGFHDSIICEYTEIGNDIVIRFDTTWDETWECYITVTFKSVYEADFKGKVGEIQDSVIERTDEGFLFTVKDGFAGWIDGSDYDAPFIKCKNIFWKLNYE